MTKQLGEPFLLILGVLATWRITALLAYERGPLGIFEAFRRSMARLRLGRLVACFHCLGIWVAAGAALILFGFRVSTILFWLATAGGTSIIERWLTGADMTGGSDDS